MTRPEVLDQMALKLFILYVLSRLREPVDFDTLWNLVFIDDGVTYFEFCECLYALLDTEHIVLDEDSYTITDKGRQNGAILEDIVSESLKKSAQPNISEFNRIAKRESMIKSEVKKQPGDSYTVSMSIDDDLGNLISIELTAADDEMAKNISNNFKTNAELIFKEVLAAILKEYE